MKNTWFTCNLGDAMLAGESLEQIRACFLSCRAGPEDASDMAVFARHESEGRLHCEVHVYFSPAAAGVAKKFDAVACPQPSAAELELLAGPESSRAILFP
jgi:hypothetical protein